MGAVLGIVSAAQVKEKKNHFLLSFGTQRKNEYRHKQYNLLYIECNRPNFPFEVRNFEYAN